MGECHTMQDEMRAGARRISRRIVTQKIIQFHDALLRELTSDNERFLQTTGVAGFLDTDSSAPGLAAHSRTAPTTRL
jgi:hypothetical protein